MAYFNYMKAIPDGLGYLTHWLGGKKLPADDRVLNVPKMLIEQGWSYTFETVVPKDDSFEAEYLLDHSPVHVFDEWTCLMGPPGFVPTGQEDHPLFRFFFRNEKDLLMAKILLG